MKGYTRPARLLLGWFGLCLGIAGLLPGIVAGAEWTLTPSLSFREAYNDNIRLTTLTHPNVTTTTIKPRADLGWATERANIDLRGEWEYNRYAGDPNLKNRTDRMYELKSAYKLERGQLALDGSYIDDTTLAQEDYSEDIGAILAQLDRVSKRLTPSWSWMLNERSNLRIDLQYQDVTYEKSSVSPYNDYTYDSGGLTYSFQWTERDQVYATISSARYTSKKRELIPDSEMVAPSRYLGSESDTLTYQFGWNHNLDPTLKLGVGYGSRESDSTTQYQVCFFIFTCQLENQTRSKTRSPVYLLSLDKDYERTTVGSKLSRTVSASGLGSEMEVDSLTLDIDHRLTEKLRLKFNFMANQRVAVNPDFSYNDRKYLRGEVSLGWKLDENWNLYAKYRYSRQSYKRTDAVASSNNVSLNIRYAWDRLSWSR